MSMMIIITHALLVKTTEDKFDATSSGINSAAVTPAVTPAASQSPPQKPNVEDFFSSIEGNQTNMFNAQASG